MIGYDKECKLIDIDSLDCLAKSNEKAQLFYVRIDRMTQSIFNPIDALNETSTKQKIKGTDIERCPFITVNKSVFDFYLNYLKSKNQSNLLQANRLLRGA